jgi:hypothetical protein
MKKIIYTLCLSISLSTSAWANIVLYDGYEINQQLNQTQLKQLSTDYIQNYFSSKQPNTVIDRLIKSNLTPIEREYVLYNLLTEISQQPPQDFFQNFVDRMKTYAIQATKAADEGHLPNAIFNLNSKAYGIENIWTAYRSEQHFNLLFVKDMQQALAEIQYILTQDSAQRRPQWLGIKNSIAAIQLETLNHLSAQLSVNTKVNSGLDALISHVGLMTGQVNLIEKALSSNQVEVRELTLRHLSTHFPAQQAKTLLLTKAQSGADRKFSTSLLSQYINDHEVEAFLSSQLGDKQVAANAAFALSQSDSLSLPTLLKKRYLLSTDADEKNHLILTLKLNQSSAAKLALDDVLTHIEKDSKASQWLKSFEQKSAGEQP